MSTDLLDLHPFTPDVLDDPYGWYERLREVGPVVHLNDPDLWMVTSYDEVTTVLRDPTLFSSQRGYAALGQGYLRPTKARADIFGAGVDMSQMRMLISVDPPEHTRIRRLLSRAFTPRAITDLEPRLREVCHEMVDDLKAKARAGDADLVRDLAAPFPVTVIAELLDVPVERRGDFRRWSDSLSGGLSGDADMAAVAESGLELFSFMHEVVERRQREPGKDLISRLVLGIEADGDDPLTLDEITLIAILLLVAGNETTTNLLGNTFHAFAVHPDQAERVYADPSLVPGAIEEVLRWDSPVQCLLRGTSAPTTLGGVDLPADGVVFISFAAGNRDPVKFPNPARFDVTRGSSDHLAFGHGVHFCLGASLARNEARLAIDALIAAGIETPLQPSARRTDGLILRGFTSYPLATPASA